MSVSMSIYVSVSVSVSSSMYVPVSVSVAMFLDIPVFTLSPCPYIASTKTDEGNMQFTCTALVLVVICT